jgi:hypothetical protein
MSTGDGVQRLVDEISRLLAAPATLESRDFALIAFCAHETTDGADFDSVRMRSILSRGSTAQTRAWFESFGIATARGPVRTPFEPELGIRTRLCIPVRHRRRLLGYVWLLDDGRNDPASAITAQAVALADRLAALLADDGSGERSDDLSDALADAVAGTGGRRAEALRRLSRQLAGRAAVVAVGSAVQLPGSVRCIFDGVGVLLVPLRSPDAAAELTGRLGAGPVGVSDVLTDPARLPECYRQAVFAATVATATGQPAARWAELGPYRLLRGVDLTDPAALDLIATLAQSSDLLETAEVFLDCAGTVQLAAAQLNIHRQTLYYRLSRIEALTGLALSSGADRLLLHLTVKLARLQAAS